jgi:hypothetical protein
MCEYSNHNSNSHCIHQILKTVRKNRQQRQTRSNSSNSVQRAGNWINLVHYSFLIIVVGANILAADEKQTCFICGEILHGDLEDVNNHIDTCLASDNNGNNNNHSTPQKSRSKRKGRKSNTNDEEVEVYLTSLLDVLLSYLFDLQRYTIGGQTRIRACSLLDGGYAGVMGTKKKKEDDEDTADLDVDGDDTVQFGQAQYPRFLYSLSKAVLTTLHILSRT